MANVDVAVGVPAPDGRGTCCLSDPIDIPEEFLWGPLINKVYNFPQYVPFPVTENTIKELADGTIHRTLVTPTMGIVENIKVDKETGVVEFHVLDKETTKPTGVVHYNILHRNPLRIEYSELSPEGVKTPLSNGGPIKQQIKEAYEAWQKTKK